MSKYLELVEKEYELGLISQPELNARKRQYNNLQKKNNKDSLDIKSVEKLNFLENDKDFFIQTEILKNLKAIKSSNKDIKGWMTFIGIMMILGILGTLMTINS